MVQSGEECNFERERERRIEENKQRLAALDLTRLTSGAFQAGAAARSRHAVSGADSEGMDGPSDPSKRKRSQQAADGVLSRASLRQKAPQYYGDELSSDQLHAVLSQEASERGAPPKRRVTNCRPAARSGRCINGGGRPTTWIGGGGIPMEQLEGVGVPRLRAMFLEVFGFHTASNNGAWLRRKLSEAPDPEFGVGRSAIVRARDQEAAIWTTGNIKAITQAEAAILAKTRNNRINPDKLIDVNGESSGSAGFSAVRPRQPRASSAVPDAASKSNTPSCTPSVTPTRAQGVRAQRALKPSRLDYSHSQLTTADEPERWQKPLKAAAASPKPAAVARPVQRLLGWADVSASLHGQLVELYWPDDGSWWRAEITQVDLVRLHCTVLYDEGSVEQLSLGDIIAEGHMRLGCAPAASGVAGASPSSPFSRALSVEGSYGGASREGSAGTDGIGSNITPDLPDGPLELPEFMRMQVEEAMNNSDLAGNILDASTACASSGMPLSPGMLLNSQPLPKRARMTEYSAEEGHAWASDVIAAERALRPEAYAAAACCTKLPAGHSIAVQNGARFDTGLLTHYQPSSQVLAEAAPLACSAPFAPCADALALTSPVLFSQLGLGALPEPLQVPSNSFLTGMSGSGAPTPTGLGASLDWLLQTGMQPAGGQPLNLTWPAGAYHLGM